MPVRRLLLALAVVAAVSVSTACRAETLQIIANRSVPDDAPLSLAELAAIYLLRATHWDDGTHIVPVNRETGSAARTYFTHQVLRQDSDTLATYWNQMHFKGKLPPVVQESEQAMLAFVRKVPGAIGYIGADTPAVGVKVLAHVD